MNLSDLPFTLPAPSPAVLATMASLIAIGITILALKCRQPETAPGPSSDAAGRPGEILPYLPFMCIITAIYLLTELAFNGRLLDVVGGMANEEEIDRIELAGRLISGVALTLAVWGSFIFPRYMRMPGKDRNGAGLVFTLIVTAALSIGAMYKIQDLIIESIVESSDAEQRYAATRLLLLTNATHQQKVQIANIDLSAEVIASPEGKAFLALLPMMGLTVKNLDARTESVTEQIVRNLVIEEVGSSAALFNEAYVPSVRELHKSYVEYADGSNEMLEALNTTPREQSEAWLKLTNRLKGWGYRPSTVPRSLWPRVRRDVQKSVPVPDNWAPYDQATFNRAVAEVVEKRAHDEFRQAMYRTGEFNRYDRPPPPPGLTFEQFAAHDPIQTRWLEQLGIDHLNLRISPTYDHETFRGWVWETIVEDLVATKMKVFQANLGDFAEGGRFEDDGKRAMKALAVPPVALFFSLVGALVHIFKLSNYALRWAFPALRWRWQLVAAACLALAWLPTTQANVITSSNLFESFQADISESFSPLVSTMTTWVIQAQPYAYPVNEAIRKNVLLGFNFGYDGASPSLPD